MATTSFKVTPEELEASAKKIESQTQEFQNVYNSIYAAVEDLRVAYQGETSEVFNRQIEAYRNDFEAALAALNRYIEFLVKYANRMRKTEEDLKSKAGTLKIGK